jgi:multiple sugar transport system ATP-binding protein
MASMTISNLKKGFGAVAVLKGVNLSIKDGEFVVLVGPSGCRKSTVLRMIARLESITSGTIDIGGRVVNDLEPRERDIAMVFQSYALYPHMTVRQNIAFKLKLRGEPAPVIDDKVGGAAQILDLETLLTTLSAPALGWPAPARRYGACHSPPAAAIPVRRTLSNLDAKLRVQMRIEIRRLHQSLGATLSM